MNDRPYTHKMASGAFNCSNEFFGQDPLPGISKQCYCDHFGLYPQEEIQMDMDKFEAERERQRQEAEAARIAAEKARLEAEAKKLAAEAAAREKAAKEERERIRK